MKSLIKKLFRKKNRFPSLITISISKQALIHNLNFFRKIAPENKVAPVLKSNAYGHGLILIANILKREKVPFFIIDSYFEARALRNENIKTPLLIIGYSPSEILAENRLKDISFTITNLETLEELVKIAKRKVRIHLKIDTGMKRQGLIENEIDEAFDLIKNSENIELEGICSHFADADNSDRSFTNSQISIWNKIVEKAKNKFPSIKYIHISATDGHIHKDAKANLSRLGIGLYGIGEKIEGLMPVLEMSSVISGIKNIKKGDKVGYGCTFTAEKDMTIATIPVGYYEGINRRLSNKGFVKIKDQLSPIIGRVSMNITTIDINNIKETRIGDKVTIISRNEKDRNSVKNISKETGTITYDITVHIPASLKRVVE